MSFLSMVLTAAFMKNINIVQEAEMVVMEHEFEKSGIMCPLCMINQKNPNNPHCSVCKTIDLNDNPDDHQN